MIFQFPDIETFRLAVTSAQVPADVSAAPAEVAFDADGRPSVRSAAGIPPKPMQNALRKLGVRQAKEHYSEAVLTVDCWPQVLPVARLDAAPEITSNTPVLFEMPAAEMAKVVSEMLRLGNDRQSYRTIAAAQGKSERVLLKVFGPPYYTLLRAIDKSTQQGANVVAYLERAPRVWVEIGHDHPMSAKIKPAAGQVLLLRPERDWTVVEDGPFQDVYEALDFQLPAATVEWQESHLKGKLAVPLRLVAGNAADVAELWVLTENAVDQLDALVRDADERLMSRLSFAVARENGATTIIIKTRPSRLDPPVLPLINAIAFKQYWKLPNLFVPIGRRLMPTLRRDAVRKLLADDPAQVVWLMPTADGKFRPEFLPDAAFRPLEDWIDYVIDHEHEPLQSWVQATRFDFDSFICHDDQPEKPKGPPPERSKRNKRGDREGDADNDLGIPSTATKTSKRKQATEGNEADFSIPAEVVAPSEVKIKLRELEKQFVDTEGPLDSPERQALWAKLARYNALDRRELEAAICWANALWELPEVPVEASLSWLHSEDKDARPVPTAEEFETALAARDQSNNDVRAFAARIIHACRQTPVPEAFLRRLPKVREYLEHNESVLGVRIAWLAWWHLARAGGQVDVLALARVRDRLLQRLLTEGLNKEKDLPYFLRTAGEQNSDRMRLVRDRALTVHKLVDKWHAGEDVKVNKPYVDLMFAFAMAKLGEATAARDLMQSATTKLLEPAAQKERPDTAHEFLLKAFLWRIENAIQGKAHAGPLLAEMMARLDAIDDGRNNTASKRYVVDRMRQQSWILEPQEKLDPYAPWKKHANELLKALSALANEKESTRLEESIRNLIRSNSGAESRLYIYAEAVPLAPRVSEDFTILLIQQVPNVLDAASKIAGDAGHLATLRDKQTQLLERSLFLAAHFDRTELVQKLFARFLEFVKARSGSEMYDSINKIARECLRSLRKLGLRDEIDVFLRQMMDLVVQGKSLTQLRMTPGVIWSEVLRTLLHLAEGWMFFGGFDRAKPFLDEAMETIANNGKAAKDRGIKAMPLTELVRTYVTAVGQGPVEDALFRIEKLFKDIEKLPNGFTTASHFSRLHLNIVEEVIRSLVSDNMALGDRARRWLDDDEYLVRRRIHADMKRLLAQSGL